MQRKVEHVKPAGLGCHVIDSCKSGRDFADGHPENCSDSRHHDQELHDVGPDDGLHSSQGCIEGRKGANQQHTARQRKTCKERKDDGGSVDDNGNVGAASQQKKGASQQADLEIEPALKVLISCARIEPGVESQKR